jgi:hypothetical protein
MKWNRYKHPLVARYPALLHVTAPGIAVAGARPRINLAAPTATIASAFDGRWTSEANVADRLAISALSFITQAGA